MPADPDLSIVIPTRDRRDSLLATLESLRNQTCDPGRYEVIVVSDGSTDGTETALADLAAAAGWAGRALRPLGQPWAGAAAARNTGLHAARGRWVLFLDDDVRADPGLVDAHLAQHVAAQGTDLVVLGRILAEYAPGALAAELGRWWVEHYRRLTDAAPDWPAFYTGNASLPRRAALACGGYDPAISYGEDVDFGYRLAAGGLAFTYAPEAVVRTRNPKPPAALLADITRSGRGSVRIHRTSPQALPGLPLAGFGEVNLRLRLARGALLGVDRVPGLGPLLDRSFTAWAGSAGRRGRRQLFELARAFYYWRGVRAEATRDEWRRYASAGVPVLMYHSISRGPRPERYAVDPRRFARQMALLRWTRRRVEPLDDVVRDWAAGRPPERGAVALTFDDGYRDALTAAWPALRRRGWPATLFVVAGRAGGTNTWDAGNQPARPLLSWDEVRRLDRAGFRAHSHSCSHADLGEAGDDVVVEEVLRSRARVEAELGHEARLFAYPFGRHGSAARTAVERAGYDAAFSTRAGLNTPVSDRWARPRVEIRGTDGLLRFALKVWVGDDPLRTLPRWVPARIRGPR